MHDLILMELFGTCNGNQSRYQLSNETITTQVNIVLNDDITETHSHARAQLLLVVSGSLIVIIEDVTYVVHPGHYVWIPPNLKHSIISRVKSEMHSIYIEPQISKGLHNNPCVMKASNLFIEMLQRYSLINQQPDTDQKMIESLVSLLLLEIQNDKPITLGLPLPKDKRLLGLCKKLFEDPLSGKTLAELLTDVPMCDRHAVRIFKAETGINFGRWRAFLKLHMSLSLLLSGYSITHVSEVVGYSNPSGFSVAFKNEFGVSPKEYLVNRADKDADYLG